MIFHLDVFRHRTTDGPEVSRCLSAAGALVVPVAAVLALGTGLVASPEMAALSPAIALTSEDGNTNTNGDHDASTAPPSGGSVSSDGRVAPGSEGPQKGGGIRNGPVSGRFGSPNRNPKSEGPTLNGVPILKPANKPGASSTSPGGSVNSGFTSGKDSSNTSKPVTQEPNTAPSGTPKPVAQEPKVPASSTPKPATQTPAPGPVKLPDGTEVNGGVVQGGWVFQKPKPQNQVPKL